MSFSFGRKNREGETLLQESRTRAKRARQDYKDGNFSGHPEDQLDMIANLELYAEDVAAAKARGWTADEKTIAAAVEEIEWWSGLDDSFRLTEKRRAEGLKVRQEHLRQAEAGLV